MCLPVPVFVLLVASISALSWSECHQGTRCPVMSVWDGNVCRCLTCSHPCGDTSCPGWLGGTSSVLGKDPDGRWVEELCAPSSLFLRHQADLSKQSFCELRVSLFLKLFCTCSWCFCHSWKQGPCKQPVPCSFLGV